MEWIKKNLAFVISCGVAVALMGAAGWFAFSNQSDEATVKEELNQLVQEWQRLNSSAQFPSKENIEAGKEDQKKIKAVRGQVAKLFPPSPNYPKMDDQAFARFLGTTIAELREGANKSGVFLPDNYDFTFAAQRKSLNFRGGSIDAWLSQLEEIKAICNVLYRARINVLDSIQRVPVSALDVGGPDFLNTGIVSNSFGVFTPYQISFRTFTPEVAAVLEGMMRSTNCMIVKSVSVAPATAPLPVSAVGTSPAVQARLAQVAQARPQPRPQYVAPGEEGGGKGGLGERRAPAPSQPATTAGVRPGVVATAPPVTVVSEQPLQVTTLLDSARLNVQ